MTLRLLLCSTLALALSTSLNAEPVTWYLQGSTNLDLDSSGAESLVTGTLIGDDDVPGVVGTIDVSGVGTYPIDGFTVLSSLALPAAGVPAQWSVASPDTVGSDGITGVTLSFLDFERPPGIPSFEDPFSWEQLLAVFGTAPGQDGERYYANLQASPTPFPVTEPAAGLLGLLGLMGFAAFDIRRRSL